MQGLFGIVQTLMICGTALGVSFVALLAMPQSKLREFLLPIVCWCVAIFCGIYALSPVDLFPEAIFGPLGYVEDVGALAAGIAAAKMAMKPPKNSRAE